jgi:hypothetical protein
MGKKGVFTLQFSDSPSLLSSNGGKTPLLLFLPFPFHGLFLWDTRSYTTDGVTWGKILRAHSKKNIYCGVNVGQRKSNWHRLFISRLLTCTYAFSPYLFYPPGVKNVPITHGQSTALASHPPMRSHVMLLLPSLGGTYGQHSPKMGINTPPGVIIAPLFPPNSAIVTYAAFLGGVTRALHPALHRCSFPLLGLISKKKETYGTLTLLFFSHKIRCNVPTRGSAFTLVIVRHLHGPLPLSGSFSDILRSTVFC